VPCPLTGPSFPASAYVSALPTVNALLCPLLQVIYGKKVMNLGGYLATNSHPKVTRWQGKASMPADATRAISRAGHSAGHPLLLMPHSLQP